MRRFVDQIQLDFPIFQLRCNEAQITESHCYRIVKGDLVALGVGARTCGSDEVHGTDLRHQWFLHGHAREVTQCGDRSSIPKWILEYFIVNVRSGV